MSNPVNPGQAFPVDAIERSNARKVAKVEHELSEAGRSSRRKSFEQYMAEVDKPLAKELELFIENNGELYQRQYLPILKNLMRKTAAGTYDSQKAITLFMYLADSGAKLYEAEVFGDTGHALRTNVGTRMAVAIALRDQFEAERALGNYDEYIPKKYQQKSDVAYVNKLLKEKASERMLRLAPHFAQGREAHKGMQVTEYCPQCGRYLTKDDIP